MAARGEFPEYAVQFFIPAESPAERVNGYIESFGMLDEQIIRFDHFSPLAAYHRFGVMKVFYDLEAGVCWFESGNRGEAEQLALLQRIRSTITGKKKS